jgi:hypothetical protein
VTKNSATVGFYFYILVEKEKVPNPALQQVLRPPGCGFANLSPQTKSLLAQEFLPRTFSSKKRKKK